jgi:hypothetical protein
MVFNIDNEIVKLAIHCKKGFICLEPGGKYLCPLEEHAEEEAETNPFLKCLKREECVYKVPISNSADFACRCPVREEIYNRYGK